MTGTGIPPTIATRTSGSSRTRTPTAGSTRAEDTESVSRLFGCERYHPPHGHWHLLDSRYKLVRVRTGRTAVRSTKIGFCIIDTARRFPSLPGSSRDRYYPAGSADCDRGSVDGLSIGWTDTYAFPSRGSRSM